MTEHRKIYLASSWRNPNQPRAVEMLRAAGYEVYDFRHPQPGNTGFSWGDISERWRGWSPENFITGLQHPIAEAGFSSDKAALDWCDICVLLLPSGRSAHLEAGYAFGLGKPTLIVLDEKGVEPELMYLLSDGIAIGLSMMLPSLEVLRKPPDETDNQYYFKRWFDENFESTRRLGNWTREEQKNKKLRARNDRLSKALVKLADIIGPHCRTATLMKDCPKKDTCLLKYVTRAQKKDKLKIRACWIKYALRTEAE